MITIRAYCKLEYHATYFPLVLSHLETLNMDQHVSTRFKNMTKPVPALNTTRTDMDGLRNFLFNKEVARHFQKMHRCWAQAT